MERIDIENGILTAFKYLGWFLFLCIATGTVSLKGSSHSQLSMLYTGYGICFLSTAVYHGFRVKLVQKASKKLCVAAIRPYRLGALLGAAVLLFAIIVVSNHGL